jgi:hypothetical protein
MANMPVYVLFAIAALVTAAAMAAVVLWFGRKAVNTLPEADWLRTFSAARYRPMARMLAEEDYRWLESQGMDKNTIRRMRRERRKIFSTYLDNMVRDFERLHLAARALLLAQQEDRPDMAERLIAVKVQFHRSLLRVRVQLFLYDLGLRNVDVTELVSGIEAMQTDLRVLMPVPQSYFAA